MSGKEERVEVRVPGLILGFLPNFPNQTTMILNQDDYRDKVLGCWIGKNVGGTIGAPFEFKRQFNDVSFYIPQRSIVSTCSTPVAIKSRTQVI